MKHYIQQYLTKEFFIYATVGLATFFIDFFLYWFLYDVLHVWYILAQTLVTPLVLLFNYNSHRRFTFSSDGAKTIQVPRYLMLASFNYAMSVGLLFMFVEVGGFNEFIGKVLTTGVIMLYNFFALKRVVFV